MIEIRGLSATGIKDLYRQLIELCNDFRHQEAIECAFGILPEHAAFGAEISDVILRSMRELLLNVRKHARATRVRMVSGWYDEDSVFLGVEDNGVGFDTTNRFYAVGKHRGFGLWSIEHRLHRLKGFTVIESKDGVSVRIVLPASLLLG